MGISALRIFPFRGSLLLLLLLLVLLSLCGTPLSAAGAEASFIPPDDVVYRSPVFVTFLCDDCHSGSNDTSTSILVYKNESVWGDVYAGPFWIDRTTRLTAVKRVVSADGTVTGSVMASSSFVISQRPTLIKVYPSPGVYIGGVDVVVYPSSPSNSFYFSLNGGARAVLSSFLVPLNGAGNYKLRLWEVGLGGSVHEEEFIYQVVQATAPTLRWALSPTSANWTSVTAGEDGAVIFHHPVSVMCVDPLQRAIPLEFGSYSNNTSMTGEEPRTLELSKPGEYLLRCQYASYHGVKQALHQAIQLKPLELPAPTIESPHCGTTILRYATVVKVKLLRDGALHMTSEGGHISLIVDGPEENKPSLYQLQRAGLLPSADSSSVTLHASLVLPEQNPFVTSTPSLPCELRLVDLGNATTKVFYARMTCLPRPSRDDPAPAAPTAAPPAQWNSLFCTARIREEVAACLDFFSTDLVDVWTHGPFMGIAVTGLPAGNAPLTTLYEERLQACLVDKHNNALWNTSSVTDDVQNVTAATSWRMTYGSSAQVTANTATVGTALLIEVEGPHAARGRYSLVYTSEPCDALGVTPLLAAPDVEGAPPPSASDASHVLWFQVPLPGKYKLCVVFPNQNGRYEVVSQRGSPLTVTSRAWPLVKPLPPATCGGPTSAGRSGVQHLQFGVEEESTSPRSIGHALILYSINAGEWQTTAMGQPISTSVVDREHPLSIVSTTLGEKSAVASTCIYYYSDAVSPPGNFTYDFYQTSRSVSVTLSHAPTNSSSAVLIAVKGTFHPNELVGLEVYQGGAQIGAASLQEGDAAPIFTTVATAPNFLDYRWAVPSAPLQLRDTNQLGGTAQVFVVIDGQRVAAHPSSIALSTLALSMEPSKDCPSGFHYKSRCVCFGVTNRTAYLCDDSAAPSSPPVPRPTSTEAPSADETPQNISLSSRLIPLVFYFILLFCIASYMYYSIKKGSRRDAINSEVP